MQQLGTLIKIRKPSKATSERAELLQFFLEKINAARKGTKYKQLKPAALAVKLSHLSKQDLYYLKSSCIDAEKRHKSFSARFWWALKPQETQV